MTAKPRSEMRSVAKAQFEGDLLQRVFSTQHTLACGIEPTALQITAKTHAQMLLQQLIRTSQTQSEISWQGRRRCIERT